MKNIFCEVFANPDQNSQYFEHYWNKNNKNNDNNNINTNINKKPRKASFFTEKIENIVEKKEFFEEIIKFNEDFELKKEIEKKKLFFKTRSQTVLFVDLETNSIFYGFRNTENYSPMKTIDDEKKENNCFWKVFQFKICFVE